MFTWEQGPDSVTIVGEMDIFSIDTLHALLVEVVAEGSAKTIDLTQVTRLDTAAAQVLMAALKTDKRGGLKVALSDEASAVLDLIGLKEALRPYLDQGTGNG